MMLTAGDSDGGGAGSPVKDRSPAGSKRSNPRAAALARLRAQREGKRLDSDVWVSVAV